MSDEEDVYNRTARLSPAATMAKMGERHHVYQSYICLT
jgi:hypothetical protein